MAELPSNQPVDGRRTLLDLETSVGELTIEDEAASDDVSLEGLEQELQGCITDDVVAMILSKGTKLRDYTKGVENKLRQTELDSIEENLTKDDARQQFLRILRTLPYGNSVFFAVRKIADPIGLFPGKLILGINKRGVHFFRPVPIEHLQSAELRDIIHYGSNNTAVFFQMRVAGDLHVFEFETKRGEEICVALQTHINDVMLHRNSKACPAANDLTDGQPSDNDNVKLPPTTDVNEKRAMELSETLEESKNKVDQIAIMKENIKQQCKILKLRGFDLKKILEEWEVDLH